MACIAGDMYWLDALVIHCGNPGAQACQQPNHNNMTIIGRIVHWLPFTHVPKIQATRNTSYLMASESLNGRKIARMAPILTIFGPNRSRRCDLFFEKFSNERRHHPGIVIVAVVVDVVGRFGVACIKGTSLLSEGSRFCHAEPASPELPIPEGSNLLSQVRDTPRDLPP